MADKRRGRGEGRGDGRGEPREARNGHGPERDGPPEPERETLTALKAILVKVAGVVKPLGLSAAESTDLVQRMYEHVLDIDGRMANEPDETRRSAMVEQVRGAVIRREDEELVVEYASAAGVEG